MLEIISPSAPSFFHELVIYYLNFRFFYLVSNKQPTHY